MPAFALPDCAAALIEAMRLAESPRDELRQRSADIWFLDELEDARDLFAIVDGVAVIPVRGMLLSRMRYGGASWATGYNVLQLQLERAFGSPRVRAIALDIHSGGGRVDGLFDLVDWMHEAKREAGKPLGAIVNTQAASAAYAIAAAADSIACPPLGGVGSIGIIAVHVGMAEALKAAGIAVTVIRSGEWKGAGNMYEQLPKKVLDDFQADTDELRELFADAVAVGRSAAGFDAAAALATEAYFYARPSKIEEALQLGMIDAIARPDEALAELIEAVAA